MEKKIEPRTELGLFFYKHNPFSKQINSIFNDWINVLTYSLHKTDESIL